MDNEPAALASTLIPIMREGVEIIKMIFFKQLKEYLLANRPERDQAYCGRLAGGVVNRLFGTENPAEPFASFAAANAAHIEREMNNIPQAFAEMCPPLTEALRVQFLCDSMEGIDSSPILVQADEVGILLHDRPVPLPRHFLDLVRRLGSGFNLLVANRVPPAGV